MAEWAMSYWADMGGKKPFERWLDKLTDQQLESVAKELELLAMCGNKLKLPHSRSLGKGLFELRERRYGLRVYYAFYCLKQIVLLGGGDKRSQVADIKIARERLAMLKVLTEGKK